MMDAAASTPARLTADWTTARMRPVTSSDTPSSFAIPTAVDPEQTSETSHVEVRWMNDGTGR